MLEERNLAREGNYFQKYVRLQAGFSNGLKSVCFENFLGKCVLGRNLENIYHIRRFLEYF